jgi:pyruvate dehydrogenase E1 component alpha subunit
MVRIRRFEERSLRAYQAKKIGGFLHLYIGQEAVAVGCCSLMGPHDHVITAYRDHGHAIAVGMDTKPLMAELYGKATGCSKGKGGSMHYFDPTRNFWGGHGIVGGQIPLGRRPRLRFKYKGLKGAAMAFMGDGAVNQGAVHEAYNLAALWNLPVVFVDREQRLLHGHQPGALLRRRPGPESADGYHMPWGTVQRPRRLRGAGVMDSSSRSRAKSPNPHGGNRHLPLPRTLGRGSRTTPTVTKQRSRSTADQGPDPGLPAGNSSRTACSTRPTPRRSTPRRATKPTSPPISPRPAPSPPSKTSRRTSIGKSDHPAERKSKGRLFFT